MDRLKHRIVVTDFQKVNGTMRGFIFGIYNNPSVVSGKNENVFGQNEDLGLSVVF